jgi:hypothetical protein
MSSGAQVDYDALAKQAGAISSTPASAGNVDYDALAKQYGAVSSVPAAPSNPVAGVLSGIGGGVFQTAEGVKNLANKALPNSMQIPDIPAQYRDQRSIAEKAGGYAEDVAEYFLGDAAFKAVPIAEKLGLAQKAVDIANESPTLAKLLHAGMSVLRGSLVGGTVGGVKGAAEGNATGGAEAGAALGAGGAAVAEATAPVAGAILRRNPFRGAGLPGSGTLATNAIDEAAEAAAKDSRVAPGKPPSEVGMRSSLDTHISQIASNERALYDKVNEVAGTDMKDLYDKREMIQDALDDPTTTNTDQLQSRLKDLDNQIGTGEKNARARGVDTEKVLDQAKAQTQQRYAVQELKSKVFNNESVVSGNKAAGAEETINIPQAIRAVENLDKPSRYAPQGSPTRLQQALGIDGAKNFKLALYDAQRRGLANARVGQVAKWAAITAGGAGVYDAARHVLP